MTSMRLSVCSALLLYSSSSFAGSIGLVTNTGLHEGKAYYYDSNGTQGIDSQFKPHVGYGFQFTLGDKDNRLMGLMRFQNSYDWPLENPEIAGDEDYTHPPYDTLEVNNAGTASIGLQWGLWGNPTGLQLIGTTVLTSGFWTKANTEYFLPEAGVGATYTINDTIQLHGEIAGGIRYRKAVYISSNVYFGVRYLFD